MQSPDQIMQGENQQLGVPQAQQQVSGLRQAITNTTNLLNQVAPSVYGRTANSLVTDAQATKQIGNEQAPISATLGKQNTDYTNASDDYKNLLGQATTLAQLKQTGQQSQLANLEDIYKTLLGKEQSDAQAAEQQREFNASNTTANAKVGASSAKSSQPSAAEVRQADQAGASQYLNSLKGGDGHVSQQTWNNAYTQWTNAGYNGSDFVKQFMPYINQRYKGYHGFS